jgi:hypothetical protein
MKSIMEYGAMDLCGMTSAIVLPGCGMVYSRVEEVLPFLVKAANDLGLVVFDWGGPSIYRP